MNLLPPLHQSISPRQPKFIPFRVSGGWMIRHPARLVALGFGSGCARSAPGTIGTLWAWLAYLILLPYTSLEGWGWGLVVVFGVGWWSAKVTSTHLGMEDSSHIVIDEIWAFWLILWIIHPTSFMHQALAFGLFRLFDAIKWGPTAWADQHFKGQGWRGAFGIMLDDVVAAGMTLLVLAVGMRLF